MAEHHSKILGPMLKDQVLAFREFSESLQGSEGDEGVEPALFEAALSIPLPKIRILLSFMGQRKEGAVGRLEGRDLHT